MQYTTLQEIETVSGTPAMSPVALLEFKGKRPSVPGVEGMLNTADISVLDSGRTKSLGLLDSKRRSSGLCV